MNTTGYVDGFPWHLVGMRSLALLLAFFSIGPLSS